MALLTQSSSPQIHLRWTSAQEHHWWVLLSAASFKVDLWCEGELFQAVLYFIFASNVIIPTMLMLVSKLTSLLPSWRSTPPMASSWPSPLVALTWKLSSWAIVQFSSFTPDQVLAMNSKGIKWCWCSILWCFQCWIPWSIA